ncbi:MAG: winged helix-turn-helix transcriptional regulator [Candidatus Hodarchaeales archaeon]
MDSIDKGLLVDLSLNARATYQELANKYGLSANAIKNRINKMISVGLIKEFFVELSNAMVDSESFVSFVFTDGSEDIIEFSEALGSDFRINTVGPSSNGQYFLIGTYPNGSSGLAELSNFIRSFHFVKKIELFPILKTSGTKVQLTHSELTIIKLLVEAPRRPISEISKLSGIAPGLINDILKNLINTRVIEMGVRMLPNVSDLITYIYQVYYEGKSITSEELLIWMEHEFPEEFGMESGISPIHDMFFVAFVVKELSEINKITQKIRQHEHIKSATTFIWEPSRVYPDLKLLRLKEMISEAGLDKI